MVESSLNEATHLKHVSELWLTPAKAAGAIPLALRIFLDMKLRCEPGDRRFFPVFHQGNRFSSITSGRLLLLHFPVDLTACPLQLAFLGLLWRSLIFHILLASSKP
jgi:hypothetical protein